MKSSIIAVVAAGVLVALTGCSKQEAGAVAGPIPESLPGGICVVSGEKIGEGGMQPATLEYQGSKITFCCPHCVPEFQKDPAKYVAMLRAGKKL